MPNEKKTIAQIKRTLESVVGNELIPGRDENGDFKIEISKLLLGFENYISETPAPEVVPKSKINSKLDTGWLEASETPDASILPISGSNKLLQNGWLADDIRGYEHTIDPIAYYAANEQDYELKVGEVAKITFDVTASPYQVPLRIKTMDGTYYEFHLIPGNTGGTSGASGNNYLLPNNTTYTNKFVTAAMYRDNINHSSWYATVSAFSINSYFAFNIFYVTNRTVYKGIISFVNEYGTGNTYPDIVCSGQNWRDTTTEWTSLGTVQFGCAQKGTILIRRLL